MTKYLPLVLPLFLAVFVGFWCLVVKMLALAGWQRLATHFQVPASPPGSLFRLSRASVGGISYKNAIKAGASPAGLTLTTGFPFGIGHAPMLIPWFAVGPFQTEKFLWQTTYKTTIQTPTSTVSLSFADEDLIKAAQPWIRIA